mmetsp:Transcript_30641/g.49144  ORF Transcript_30641/g.49144 Transcript_30641/m.49144 type:complete len:86 (+) Transcript_30641:1682-1939(+)
MLLPQLVLKLQPSQIPIAFDLFSLTLKMIPSEDLPPFIFSASFDTKPFFRKNDVVKNHNDTEVFMLDLVCSIHVCDAEECFQFFF